MSSRVYVYGCLDPDMNGDMALQQLVAAHRYQNKLIELERVRRAAKDPLVFAEIPQDLREQLDALMSREAVLVEEIKGASKQARRKVAAAPEIREELKRIRADMKELRPRVREARKAAREANAEAIKAIDEEYYEQQRQARGACGAFWGTYLLVEAAHDMARKACERETWCSDDPIGQPSLPRFRRFDGSGSLGVQLQNVVGDSRRAGIPVSTLVGGTDTRLRIDAAPTPVDGRNGKSRPRVWMRIGRNGREPIWVRLPVILHRPLPDNGIVTWAKLVRTRVEAHYRWDLQLTVDVLDARPSALSSMCEISLSPVDSLEESGGIVLATTSDAPMVLPARIVGALRKADDIACLRDNRFNAARDILAMWMSEIKPPEWMAEATATMSQWRSIGRLASLAIQWRANRFDGDESPFQAIEAWRKRDKHLWEYQENMRDQAIRSRLDLYRNLGRRIADKFGTVVLDDQDLRKRQREKLPSTHVANDPRQAINAKWCRKTACLSSLRLCIRQSVEGSGGNIQRASAEGVPTIPCGSASVEQA